jgi:hypothetical protein
VYIIVAGLYLQILTDRELYNQETDPGEMENRNYSLDIKKPDEKIADHRKKILQLEN